MQINHHSTSQQPIRVSMQINPTKIEANLHIQEQSSVKPAMRERGAVEGATGVVLQTEARTCQLVAGEWGLTGS